MTSKRTGEEEVQAPACPYAAAMQRSSSASSLPEMIQLKECPAFSKECPFKGAKTAEEVSEKLQQIPQSHLKANGAFFKALEFFHESTPKHGSLGSCPVKHALPNQDWTFNQVMEENSLAAIMGKLAQEWESLENNEINGERNHAGGSNGGDEDTYTTASINSDDWGTTASTTVATSPTRKNKTATPRLSDALKSGTAVAHKAAESVHFVKNFIRGKIDRDLYGLLVAQLYHVYGKLEEALDEHAPQYFAACHFPTELHRREALEEDLEFWHSSTPDISPATQDYIDRINYLREENPLLLLAHAYTRYLGDLSGGKVLSRVARRALKLQQDGLAFYDFPHVKSFKLFKDHYRKSLNELPLSESQVFEIVQEANVAFLLNMRLFEELDVIGGVPDASIRPLESVYSTSKAAVTRITSGNGSNNSATDKCPFIQSSKASKTAMKGVCPWPFILLHDPIAGLKSWKTWLVIGLLLAYLHHFICLQGDSPNATMESMPRIKQVVTKSVKPISINQLYDNWHSN